MPLFVRLPRDQAAQLDRLVDSTGRRKQELVSELLADQIGVGRIEFAEQADEQEVMTLEEAGALLRLPTDVVRAGAAAGELPGRAFGEEWRFSRTALLAWLAGGEAPTGGPAGVDVDRDGG